MIYISKNKISNAVMSFNIITYIYILFKQMNIYNFSNYIQVKIIRIVIVRGDTLNAFLLMSAAKTN